MAPVTAESFLNWLAMKKKQKEDLRMGASGRDLFVMDPSLFVDEDDALDEFERDREYRLSEADEAEAQLPLSDAEDDDEDEDTASRSATLSQPATAARVLFILFCVR
jgi:hypothetical protein